MEKVKTLTPMINPQIFVVITQTEIAHSRSITKTTTCFGSKKSARRGATSIVEPKPVTTRTVNPKRTSKPIKR